MTSAGLVLVSTVALAAQAGQPHPAGPPSLILGRVVDGTTNRPVVGAIVTIEGVTAGSSSPRAMTNGAGQFVFRKVPSGSVLLTASRNGYVDGRSGQLRPGGTGRSLRVEPGQRIGDVVIRIWKHGAISGTVTDELGEPLIGVQLRAFQRRYVAARRRIVQNGTASTDFLGAVDDVEPGEWFDPSFLQRLAPAAIKISIDEGDKKTQDLRIGGGA